MHFLASSKPSSRHRGSFSLSSYSNLLYYSVFLFFLVAQAICFHTHSHRRSGTNASVCTGTRQWWCPSCTTPAIAPGRGFLWWLQPCGSWPSPSPVPCCSVSTPQVRSLHFACFQLPVSESSTHALLHTRVKSCRIECEPWRCRVIFKFRVHILSSYRLGSTVGHEM